MSDANYTVQYNEELVNVQVHIPSTSVTSTLTYFSSEILKDGSIDLRPPMRIIIMDATGRFSIVLMDNNYAVGRVSTSSASYQGIGLYANFTYKRK